MGKKQGAAMDEYRFQRERGAEQREEEWAPGNGTGGVILVSYKKGMELGGKKELPAPAPAPHQHQRQGTKMVASAGVLQMLGSPRL